ncbi:MAG TPA: hypothetical protein VNG71_05205 [Pyrinomonadaceae bacterium]|nr:hypothetical protein [Pyrinomonadaceae bacterium]
MHFQNQKSRFLVFALALIISCNFIPTARAQTNRQAPVTEDERREAHQLSVTFTKRLGETLDFEVVMRELFVPDAVERYVASEKKKAAQSGYPWVILSQEIFIDVALLDKANADDWRNLYVQTNNFVILGFVRGLRSNIDFEKLKPTDLYPAAVIQLLDHDPLLKTFILKKARSRNLRSVADMRIAATTLARANELMRKDSQPIDLEAAFFRIGTRHAATQARGDLDLDKLRDQAIHVELESNAYPSDVSVGGRNIVVTTLSFYVLSLARTGDRLKIMWAYPAVG